MECSSLEHTEQAQFQDSSIGVDINAIGYALDKSVEDTPK